MATLSKEDIKYEIKNFTYKLSITVGDKRLDRLADEVVKHNNLNEVKRRLHNENEKFCEWNRNDDSDYFGVI